MSGESPNSVHGLVDHLFRRESGRMVAALTRSLGPVRLDLAEEVVQESLVQALRRWPFHGVPENPAAWLFRVARNLALDRLRREAAFRGKEPEIREGSQHHDPGPFARFTGEIGDDLLRLIFLCCHPQLPRDGRVALTLRTALGFSVREISRAFLASEPTIAQRLVRAQRGIRKLGLPFEVPGPADLEARLDAVLEVIYLVFNEGYAAHEGADLVRRDLCEEALRLAGELATAIPRPAVHALASLLCFQASRLAARVGADGELVLLPDQDRSLWDRSLIGRGFAHLDRAAEGDRVTAYHLQAAIASQHAVAASDAGTDWAAILNLYDQLLEVDPSPIVELNRAVALGRALGPRQGLESLAGSEGHPSMASYYLLHATRGELHSRLGETQEAAACYRRALECMCAEPERRFLMMKLAALKP